MAKKRKKKNDEAGEMSRKSSGFYQSTPWTEAEVELIFKKSKGFRSAMMRAVRRIHRVTKKNLDGTTTQPDVDTALDLAKRLVPVSIDIGTRLGKRYPHPTVLAWWITYYGTKTNNFIPELGSTDISNLVGSLLVNYHTSVGLANTWAAFSEKAFEGTAPFFMRRNLHPLKAENSGSMNGVRLRSIVLRMPVGNEIQFDGQNRPYSMPSMIASVTVDFTTEAAIRQFGEVWMAVSPDGKSMTLASKKGEDISLDELIKLGRETGRVRSSVPNSVSPPRGTKAVIPPRVKELIKTVEKSEATAKARVAIDR